MQEPPACQCSASQECGKSRSAVGSGAAGGVIKGWGWEGRGWMEFSVPFHVGGTHPENHEYRGGITAENETPFQV